eukprot:TRINITY_DN11622_c0_g1_i2.p1 TRINITY_DN11622_c0_g1~~TRINITY_DN11622_c0_g1_i2.p1  ORF type:complete len:710 (-),score=168.62 TRINITY_DN11622_c0_g1_i2:34-2163(-)
MPAGTPKDGASRDMISFLKNKLIGQYSADLSSCLLTDECLSSPHVIAWTRDSAASLTCVWEISLARNCLRNDIPDIIGIFKWLNVLDMSRNQIENLSGDVFKHLRSLRSLNLSYNMLSSLPTQIVSLRELRELRIDHNSLTCLPPEIGTLVKLEELFMHNNKIEKLETGCVGHLVNLTTLWMHTNEITHVPTDFGNLAKLRNFLLFRNPLVFPPKEICFTSIETFLAFMQAEHNGTGGQSILNALNALKTPDMQRKSASLEHQPSPLSLLASPPASPRRTTSLRAMDSPSSPASPAPFLNPLPRRVSTRSLFADPYGDSSQDNSPSSSLASLSLASSSLASSCDTSRTSSPSSTPTQSPRLRPVPLSAASRSLSFESSSSSFPPAVPKRNFSITRTESINKFLGLTLPSKNDLPPITFSSLPNSPVTSPVTTRWKKSHSPSASASPPSSPRSTPSSPVIMGEGSPKKSRFSFGKRSSAPPSLDSPPSSLRSFKFSLLSALRSNEKKSSTRQRSSSVEENSSCPLPAPSGNTSHVHQLLVPAPTKSGKVVFNSRTNQRLTLRDLLAGVDRLESAKFCGFLKTMYCDEIFYFWKSADDFQKIAGRLEQASPTEHEALVTEATEHIHLIYNNFLEPGSPQEINVDHTVRTRLKEVISSLDQCGGNIFDIMEIVAETDNILRTTQTEMEHLISTSFADYCARGNLPLLDSIPE